MDDNQELKQSGSFTGVHVHSFVVTFLSCGRWVNGKVCAYIPVGCAAVVVSL